MYFCSASAHFIESSLLPVTFQLKGNLRRNRIRTVLQKRPLGVVVRLRIPATDLYFRRILTGPTKTPRL